MLGSTELMSCWFLPMCCWLWGWVEYPVYVFLVTRTIWEWNLRGRVYGTNCSSWSLISPSPLAFLWFSFYMCWWGPLVSRWSDEGVHLPSAGNRHCLTPPCKRPFIMMSGSRVRADKARLSWVEMLDGGGLEWEMVAEITTQSCLASASGMLRFHMTNSFAVISSTTGISLRATAKFSPLAMKLISGWVRTLQIFHPFVSLFQHRPVSSNKDEEELQTSNRSWEKNLTPNLQVNFRKEALCECSFLYADWPSVACFCDIIFKFGQSKNRLQSVTRPFCSFYLYCDSSATWMEDVSVPVTVVLITIALLFHFCVFWFTAHVKEKSVPEWILILF